MSEEVFDKSSLLNRVLGDEDLVREVIEVFLSDIPNKINAMKQALDKREASQVRDQAHAVKGAAMNVSALALRETAFQMEQAGESEDMEKAISLMPEMEKQFEILKDTLVQSGLA